MTPNPASKAVRTILVGALVALTTIGPASWWAMAQASCQYEYWVGTDDGRPKNDSDDGVYEDNDWYSQGGADTLRSEACDDTHVDGQAGLDVVGGGSGIDYVYGGSADDWVYGGAGATDLLYGEGGSDHIMDAESSDYDYLYGGTESDTLDATDTDSSDELDGGAGSDSCFKDTGDRKANCEFP